MKCDFKGCISLNFTGVTRKLGFFCSAEFFFFIIIIILFTNCKTHTHRHEVYINIIVNK